MHNPAMRFLRPATPFLTTIFIAVLPAGRGVCAELVNDREITLHSARETSEKRRALIKYIWGADGFPDRRLPTTIKTNVTSPVKQLSHLSRVDELQMDLA